MSKEAAGAAPSPPATVRKIVYLYPLISGIGGVYFEARDAAQFVGPFGVHQG